MDLTETRYELTDGIAQVTLCRPDRLNAFTLTMRKELVRILEAADGDDRVRVVVVTGSGRAFCAGADLSSGGRSFDRREQEGREVRPGDHRDGGGRVALAAYQCRKPVIAAINGHAVGVGITMTLAMDMRFAAEDAKIGFVFTRRGVVPEACSTWFLPRIVGAGKAAELLYTGRVFRAREEAGSGLFNAVIPAHEVLPRATAVAREIAANTSAVSVALGKGLLRYGLGEAHPHGVHLMDSRCMYWTGLQKDCQEGVESFLARRPPRFTMSPTRDMPDFCPWWKVRKG
jgi:enoyl-CoA hydratase/carnithine racemase